MVTKPPVNSFTIASFLHQLHKFNNMPSKKHYKDSTQEDCIDAINKFLIEDQSMALTYISASYSVSNCTLQRWYNKYISCSEYPHKTRKNLKKYRKSKK